MKCPDPHCRGALVHVRTFLDREIRACTDCQTSYSVAPDYAPKYGRTRVDNPKPHWRKHPHWRE